MKIFYEVTYFIAGICLHLIFYPKSLESGKSLNQVEMQLIEENFVYILNFLI